MGTELFWLRSVGCTTHSPQGSEQEMGSVWKGKLLSGGDGHFYLVPHISQSEKTQGSLR
jgi:hypothetical protein